MVKKDLGFAASAASFSMRSATRTARIGPPGGFASPKRFKSAFENGRTHAKALSFAAHARRPYWRFSLTSGSAVTSSSTSSIVAAITPSLRKHRQRLLEEVGQRELR